MASYEEVLELPNHPEILLVDVREAQELVETGRIPTSINVPRKNIYSFKNVFEATCKFHYFTAVATVEQTFSADTTPEEFTRLYGRTKPTVADPIIVSCRSGRRSQLAAERLVKLGYDK